MTLIKSPISNMLTPWDSRLEKADTTSKLKVCSMVQYLLVRTTEESYPQPVILANTRMECLPMASGALSIQLRPAMLFDSMLNCILLG